MYTQGELAQQVHSQACTSVLTCLTATDYNTNAADNLVMRSPGTLMKICSDIPDLHASAFFLKTTPYLL